MSEMYDNRQAPIPVEDFLHQQITSLLHQQCLLQAALDRTRTSRNFWCYCAVALAIQIVVALWKRWL